MREIPWRHLVLALITCGFLAVSACGSPYPGVPLAAPRSYSNGEDALARGDYKGAVGHFTAYLSSGRPTYRARALYQLAQAQYYMEEYKDAQESLARLEKEFPGFGRKQVTAMHGDLAYAQGNRVDAVLLWESAYARATAEERDVLRPRIAEAIRYLEADEAKELASMLTTPQIYELALQRVDAPFSDHATLGGPETDPFGLSGGLEPFPQAGHETAGTEIDTGELAGGRPSEGQREWREIAATESETRLDPELGELDVEDAKPPAVITAVPDGPAQRARPAEMGMHVGPRIAAVLPLTGSGRAEGARALTALRRSIDASTLVVRDSGSDPVEAVELVRQLSADRDVIAVLGPMLPAEIEAIRNAGVVDLPILPLVDRPAATSAIDPAVELAEHAVRSMGATRVGILTPDLKLGVEFARNVRALDAAVVGTHLYNPREFDPDTVIAAVQRWTDDGGVDAVFIPDTAPRALRVAAAARAVAPRLLLLGDSGWNDIGALAAAGDSVDGAVIVGGGPGSGDVADTITRVAAVLQRAVALGESDRSQTRVLLDEFSEGSPRLVLLQVRGGRPQPIR